MKNTRIIILFALTLFFMNASAGHAANISYTVTFPEAQAHYADIEMRITGLSQESLTLKMPVWTPGSYLVREYAKNVEGFAVSTKGKSVFFTKTRKNWWQISTKGISEITVKYSVYANEISVRTSAIDDKHGFLSPAGMFIYPEGMLHHPSTIHIVPFKGWDKISTSLEMVRNDPFTRYSPDYDILFDSPIEVGIQDIFYFDAAGVRHEVAMHGGGNYDKEKLKVDLAKMVETETAMYGENPNKHFTFIVHNYQRSGGGLEHLSSTVLGGTREAYNTEKGYYDFLSLAAHEYFHIWNVKRLRPIALGPFDYDNENYTTDLWIAEGFTAYYQDKVLRHAGICPTDKYLQIVTNAIDTLENHPGKKYQSLTESSYDAWIKAYRPNENSNNSSISYYNKGSVIAVLLDLEIINDSKGKYSLDDVLKYMYNGYYKIKKRGYTDAEFKHGLEQFAGKKLDDFYAKYVNGVADIDYDKYLGYAGYKLTDTLAETNHPALGITTKKTDDHFYVMSVLRGSAGWVDGINVHDELIAIDDKTITDIAHILDDKKVGDKIKLTIKRDGQTISIPVTLHRDTKISAEIDELPHPSAEQLVVRKKWLGL